jgi:hypothetical protein
VLRRALVLACWCVLPVALAAPIAPPSENPISDGNQASKKPEDRLDANALKPVESPIRVDSEAVKLPDRQFVIPADRDEPKAPPPAEAQPQYRGPPPDRPPPPPKE